MAALYTLVDWRRFGHQCSNYLCLKLERPPEFSNFVVGVARGVHPQGREKHWGGANLQEKVVSAPPPRQRVHPRGRGRVQLFEQIGRYGRWERLFRQF